VLVQISCRHQALQKLPKQHATQRRDAAVNHLCSLLVSCLPLSDVAHVLLSDSMELVCVPISQQSNTATIATVLLQVLAEDDDPQVARDVVGIKFAAGEVSSHLPPVPADEMLLPPPYELRVLSQPPKWPKRLPLTNFKVWTLPPASDAAPADESGTAVSRAESPDVAGGVGSRPLSGLSKLGTAEGTSPSPRSKNTPRGKSASNAAAASRPPSAPPQAAQPEEEVARQA
jgi:hypothetical protein